MSGRDTGQHRALPRRFMRAALSAYNSRRSAAEQLERLERELAEERRVAESLRETVADLRFQAETLEKTYSKQLADARARGEAAERELDELQGRLAALETGHEKSERLLTDARAELERVMADRALLRDALASSDASEVAAVRKRYAEARYDAGLATIDELMDVSTSSSEAGVKEDVTRSKAAADEESQPEDMVSPDLVFAPEEGSESEPDG